MRASGLIRAAGQRRLRAGALPLLAGAAALLGGPRTEAAEISFANQILPILESRCVACHPATGGRAGLSLTSRAALLRGGQSGPAVVPGDPDGSLLLAKVSGPSPAMPAVGEPLETGEIDLLRQWIRAGGPVGPDGDEPRAWWSFRPLARPAVPSSGAAWARNEIDRFIYAALEARGLTPTKGAGRTTLIRRLTFDLHGLPPTPAEVEAFETDPAPDAFARLVDRLLASPRYGERWGRHWLDVAHYGESHGYDKDKPRRNAWPYRDYVIRSFNADKPYARFVREQVAGDVLWPEAPQGLIATGFVAAGPWDYVGHAELREGTKDKQLARLLDRDDMVAATMSTFTSLTVHCARCHDHKFDPIQQTDYYALQAVFAGVDRADQPYFADPAVHVRGRRLWLARGQVEAQLQPYLRRLTGAATPEIRRIDMRLAELAEELRQLLPKVGEIDTPESLARRQAVGVETEQLRAERRQLAIASLAPEVRAGFEELEDRRKQLEAAFEALPEARYVYSAASYFATHGTFAPAWKPRPVHVLGKGSVEAPGELMGPGAVEAVAGLPGRFELDSEAGEGAGRAALAEWLAHHDNPLTWRSIVNRVWHYHFGRGLADSPNDFGRMGALPTHPELLDWLAVEFRDSGGSLKALHRRILLSATYRQASDGNPAHAQLDADNRYLWRMNRLRLDAESVRDAVLAAAGQLDLSMGGPSAEHFFFQDDHSPVYDYARFDVASPAARRRSVYRFLVRSVQDPFMESLDCADPSLLVAKRSSTLTAVQALALLNDPLMVEQARRFANRLREAGGSAEEHIDLGFRLAFGRPADGEEVRALAEHARRHGLENAARLLLNSNEFLFVD